MAFQLYQLPLGSADAVEVDLLELCERCCKGKRAAFFCLIVPSLAPVSSPLAQGSSRLVMVTCFKYLPAG